MDLGLACIALAGWLAAASLLGSVLAVADKRAARRGRRRVRERTLLAVALAGGWPGLLLAFVLARHKTRKARFLVPFAGLALANLALAWLAARWLGCLPSLS